MKQSKTNEVDLKIEYGLNSTAVTHDKNNILLVIFIWNENNVFF